MKIRILFYFILTLSVLSSCARVEGYGGKATIQGKVYGLDYNTNGNLVSEGYLGDTRVFIAKHGSINYFDDIRTAYDGSFVFDYLQVGKYDLWSFGDCDSCPWSQTFTKITVEITGKNEVLVSPDIEITF